MATPLGIATYQLWYSDEETSYAFFSKGDPANMALLEPDAKLIWEVDAESWEDAVAKQARYLGWDT